MKLLVFLLLCSVLLVRAIVENDECKGKIGGTDYYSVYKVDQFTLTAQQEIVYFVSGCPSGVSSKVKNVDCEELSSLNRDACVMMLF